MKYPKWWETINRILGVISGALIFVISILSVIEVVMRNIFRSPTVFTADVSYYLLIWAIFLAGGFAFQQNAHVRTDLVLNLLPVGARKIVSILSYFVAIFTCTVFCIYSWKFLMQCYNMNRLTYAMMPILQWKLVISMVIGFILMIITLVFMILDIIANGKKYL